MDTILFPKQQQLKAFASSDELPNDIYEVIQYQLKYNENLAKDISYKTETLIDRLYHYGFNKSEVMGVCLSLEMFEVLFASNYRAMGQINMDQSTLFGLDIIITKNISNPQLQFKPIKYITDKERIKSINNNI